MSKDHKTGQNQPSKNPKPSITQGDQAYDDGLRPAALFPSPLPIGDYPDHPTATNILRRTLLQMQNHHGNNHVSQMIQAKRSSTSDGSPTRLEEGASIHPEDEQIPEENLPPHNLPYSFPSGHDENPHSGNGTYRSPDDRILQRDETLYLSERELIDAALASKDPVDVKQISNYDEASEADLINLLYILFHQDWYGPIDKLHITRIWQAFADPKETLSFHIVSWRKSVRLIPDLPEKIPGIAEDYEVLEIDFMDDVRYIADLNLAESLELLDAEMERYGINAEPGEDGAAGLPETRESLQQLQEAASVVQKAKKVQEDTRNKKISFPSWYGGAPTDYQWLYAEESSSDGPSDANLLAFDPDDEPQEQDGLGYAQWLTLKGEYDKAAGVIQRYTELFPSLYPIMERGGLDNLNEEVTAQEARQTLESVLLDVQSDIDRTRVALLPAINDLDPRELKHIHQKLFKLGQGVDQGVTHPWNEWYYRLAAEKAVEDYEATNFWIELGISTAVVGLMLFGPIGGPAALAAAASLELVNIGMKWEKVQDLTTAHDAAMREDLQIVSQQQVNAAVDDAMLDTSLLLLDMWEISDAIRMASRFSDLGDEGVDIGRRALSDALEESPDLLHSLEPGNPLAEALQGVPQENWEDFIEMWSKVGAINDDTIYWLGRKPDILEAIADYPQAARLLKRCGSDCFPPEATADHLRQVDLVLKKLKDNDLDYKHQDLKDYLYANRDDLDSAVTQIEADLDIALTYDQSQAPFSWPKWIISPGTAGPEQLVWVNTRSKIYHLEGSSFVPQEPGAHWKQMTLAEAEAYGAREAVIFSGKEGIVTAEALEVYDSVAHLVDDYEALREVVSGHGHLFEVDHLVEKRTLATLNVNLDPDVWPSMVVPKNKAIADQIPGYSGYIHQTKTSKMHGIIPHAKEDYFTAQDIWDAHVKVLTDLGLRNELVRIEPLFEGMGVIFRRNFPPNHFKAPNWPFAAD